MFAEIINVQQCLIALKKINRYPKNQTEMAETEKVLEMLLQNVSISLLNCKRYEPEKNRAVLKELNKIALEWNTSYSAVKEHFIQTKRRLLQNLNLKDVDIDRILDAGQEMVVMSASLQMDDLSHLEDLVAHIDERHTEILKLERDVREVMELFKDLSVLVDTQGTQLNSIDMHISKSVDHTMSAEVEIVQAEKLQTKGRKYQCCCCLVLILILLVSVLVSYEKLHS